MQRSILIILIPVILFFILSELAAQELEIQGNLVAHIEGNESKKADADTAAVIVSDSLLVSDSLSYVDTLVTEEQGLPDEDPSRIFYDKLDSLANTWYIKNLFHGDTINGNDGGGYPSDLPDSVYIARLQAIQQVIPLSYNKLVKNFIRMYTEKRRNLVEIILGLSAYYFPVFEEVLDKNDMPLELKYLPVIESALNPKARSRAGANGLWQFMYQTGRQCNLEITSFVDERSDPLKSTEAAVMYLKALFEFTVTGHLQLSLIIAGRECYRVLSRSATN